MIMMRLAYRSFAVVLLPLIIHGFAPSTSCSHSVTGRRVGSYQYDTDTRSTGRSTTTTTSNRPLKRTTIPALVLFQLKLPAELPRTHQPNHDEDQPLLARAYSRALSAALRCGTLFGTMDGLVVRCEASSNRSVALGRISSLRIAFDRLSSPLLKTRDFQLVGDDLELGLKPLLLLTTPFLLLVWGTRRTLSFLLCLLVVPRLLRKAGVRKEAKKVSVVTYRLGLSGEDLSYPNTLLRMAVSRAMDHLLRNSVLGVLTESALAAVKAQTKAATGTDTNADRMPTPEEQMAQLATALDDGGSTTKIELQRARIGDNGRILLDAVAAFPDPSSGTTSRLDIVVRLALSPLDEDLILQTTTSTTSSYNDPPDRASILRPNGCGIMASNAELKASFNKETMGMPLEIFGKPIPDLWIPVVSGGVAFPLGYRHRVVSVETRPSQDRMDVCGELYFNGDAPIQRKKNPWDFLAGSGGGSSPPPPKRPALPGDKQR
jgi:hypothetical protein